MLVITEFIILFNWGMILGNDAHHRHSEAWRDTDLNTAED